MLKEMLTEWEIILYSTIVYNLTSALQIFRKYIESKTDVQGER